MTSKHFPAWFLGQHPDKRVILASYEASFAASFGRKARLLMEEHGDMWGVKVSGISSAADRWDLEGHDGGMVTAGVGGPITGRGADLLIIDDYCKNYEEAHSETIREKTWEWFTSTAYTRLEPGATCIVIATRWHEDDLIGRIQERLGHEPWKRVVFPALAEHGDSLGRRPGEALWPERFDVKRLEEIRATLGSYQWSSLYQQRPTPAEGGMFKRPWLASFIDVAPVDAARVRAWDKAATEGAGDWSAGVLLARNNDGVVFVEDVIRGQWSSGQREDVIRQTAELDRRRVGKRYSIWIEREGGSGGKDSAEITIKGLMGFDVHAENPTGPKDARARPFAAWCEAGNVKVVRGDWNQAYINELCAFPGGVHDDQVDASSLAFNKLALIKRRPIGVF